MTAARTLVVIAITLIVIFGAKESAFAQTNQPAAFESGLYVDVEIDPIAYAMRGYSLHLGVGYERVRLDVGAFAMSLPEMFHGNQGFDVYFDGFGFKLQVFPFAEQAGPFAGISGGFAHPLVRRRGTHLASRDTQFGIGTQIGWRIDLPASFYVTPWVGLDYNFSAESPTLDGHTFENNTWTVFPTLHLGYRFQ